MKFSNLANIIKSFYLIFLISSCNHLKLENEQAKELIIKSLNLPIKHSVIVEYGFNGNGFYQLQKAGLINYEVEYIGFDGHRIFVEPTELGKPYFIGGNANTEKYEFKTYDTEFGNIIGISYNEEQKTATVRYTINNVNITPVGDILSKINKDFFSGQSNSKDKIVNTQEQDIIFKKFDNGWLRN